MLILRYRIGFCAKQLCCLLSKHRIRKVLTWKWKLTALLAADVHLRQSNYEFPRHSLAVGVVTVSSPQTMWAMTRSRGPSGRSQQWPSASESSAPLPGYSRLVARLAVACERDRNLFTSERERGMRRRKREERKKV